jgi:hypothetical protein
MEKTLVFSISGGTCSQPIAVSSNPAVLKLWVATLLRVAKSFLRVAKISQDFLTNLNFKDLPS